MEVKEPQKSPNTNIHRIRNLSTGINKKFDRIIYSALLPTGSGWTLCRPVELNNETGGKDAAVVIPGAGTIIAAWTNLQVFHVFTNPL